MITFERQTDFILRTSTENTFLTWLIFLKCRMLGKCTGFTFKKRQAKCNERRITKVKSASG